MKKLCFFGVLQSIIMAALIFMGCEAGLQSGNSSNSSKSENFGYSNMNNLQSNISGVEDNYIFSGNVGIGVADPVHKLDVEGTISGAVISSNNSPVGLETNILFNAMNRYTVTQTGPAPINLDMLFDGNFLPSYSTTAPSFDNPQVITISDLNTSHCQAGTWIGYTTRYYHIVNFKLEVRNIYNGANEWVVLADYSENSYSRREFMVRLPSIIVAEIRLTIYKADGDPAQGADGCYGLSEFFFLHPEGNRIYSGLLPSTMWEVNGNVGIGTKNPTSKLQVPGLSEHANNAAAKSAGLSVGAFYRTGDLLKVVH
ncbi:MAG: hypothetical protein GY754_31390 [bacterium]|nr:hypothetical protein [bacterium]